ncbi:MAG: cation:proton antiporter [Thermoplasmata archaeon]
MMNISMEILHFMILVSISLLVARIFSSLGKRYFNLPEVVSEIITGIIIGPYALGSISIMGFALIPRINNGFLAPVSDVITIPQAFYIFAQIGIIILLFQVGLNTSIETFVNSMKTSLSIALGESMIPFFAGFTFVYFYTSNIPMALFIGVVITSSSTGITARVLYDMGKINYREGIAIMSTTVLVDVISITLLALITSLNTNMNDQSIMFMLIKAIIFWAITLFIGLKFKKYIKNIIYIFRDGLTKFSFILLLLFIFVMVSISLDLTIIVGSYAFGLILSTLEKKNDITQNFEALQNFFTPIFFVSVGMLVNIRLISNDILTSIMIFTIAVISKIFGGSITARMLRYSWKESLIIGAGLLSMGEIALILSNNAILYGIINNQIYSSTIFVAIGTTILSPIILTWIYKK